MRAVLDSFGSPFFRRALLEAVLVGVIGGIVGVHVILRRLPFFVVAMSHATLPGVAVASALGVSVILGGMGFGLLVVLAVVALGTVRLLDDSAVTGVVLAGAFALGVLVVSARPGSSRDLSAYLVGSVLTVSSGDVLITVIVGAVVLALLSGLHKELVFSVFDSQGAAAAGYSTVALDLMVLAAATVTLALATPAVGTLLAVTLLTVPALTARMWAASVASTMVLAAALGATSGFIGLCVSAAWRVSAGGAIALTASALFTLSLLARSIPRAKRVS